MSEEKKFLITSTTMVHKFAIECPASDCLPCVVSARNNRFECVCVRKNAPQNDDVRLANAMCTFGTLLLLDSALVTFVSLRLTRGFHSRDASFVADVAGTAVIACSDEDGQTGVWFVERDV